METVVFSDLPIAWALQAKGFYYSAESLLRGNTITAGKKFVSTEEIYLSHAALRTACYLLAHTLELCLKALYCLNEREEADVEKYSHDIRKLLKFLVDKQIISEQDVHQESFELAYLLLDWYGRYHRPLKKKIEKTFNKLYIQSPDNSELWMKKFNIDNESYGKLHVMAKIMLNMLNIQPASIEHLIFDPF